MLTPIQLDALASEIERLGYDRKTAGHYAALIGDTPAIDEQGRVVVEEDDGTELARLPLERFGYQPRHD